ncbi:MAG: UvrD-helicase domain-containing protein, partial [Angelakisella sp.]
ELRERLAGALGEATAKDIAAATFHSTCVRILRSEVERLGYTSSFTIYDSDDSIRIIKESMNELNLDEKQFIPRMMMNLISGAKDKMLSPAEMAKAGDDNFVYQTAAKIYDKYQTKLKAANAVDFDDIIILTVELFQKFPEVLEKYRNRWKYVMVDEYQDTNHTQYLLVSLLAAGHHNICVVGDDDQSIYKFRGATIENILSFENQFTNTKVVRLEQNYRCTSKILDAANGVIANNTQRKGKTLWTENGEGESIVCFNGTDERREAAYIADTIQANQREGAAFRDHAVLYRMNAQSGTLEQMFIRKNIPYRIIGGRKFFDRKEIRDVLAYLQVINNPADDLRMKRIINEPKRGIGDSTVAVSQEIGAMLGISLFEVIKNSAEYAPLSKKAGVLTQFAGILGDIAAEAESCSLADTLDKVLERTG